MVGRAKVQKHLKAMLDWLESDESLEESSVGAVFFIVETNKFIELEDTGETIRTSEFRTYCSDSRQWIQRAMVNEAVDMVEPLPAIVAVEDDGDED